MPVHSAPTPNPNAMKFTVGRPVGGPGTFSAGNAEPGTFASDLLALDGVVSLFLTADFVTITKTPAADWGDIADTAVEILESAFPD